MALPYVYISCPCTDVSVPVNKRPELDTNDEEQERTFDPRSTRTSYSLYPLEYLMYCEDCQQIRCPRCTTEEIVCWYCPGCLFEIPTTQIKSEGNRWVRIPTACKMHMKLMANSLLSDVKEIALTVPYVLHQWLSMLSKSQITQRGHSSLRAAIAIGPLKRLEFSLTRSIKCRLRCRRSSTKAFVRRLAGLLLLPNPHWTYQDRTTPTPFLPI